MGELEAMRCQVCGAPLNPDTLQCEYCGTFHKRKIYVWNGEMRTQFIPYRPGAHTLACREIVPLKYTLNFNIPQSEIEKRVKQKMVYSFAEAIEPYVEFKKADYPTENGDEVYEGRIRVLEKDYRF